MEYKIIEVMFEGENPKSVFEMGSAAGLFLVDLQKKYGDIIVGGNDIRRLDILEAKKNFPKYQYNFSFHILFLNPLTPS